MAMHLVHSKDLETKQQRKELGLCLQKTPSQSLTSNIESAHAIQLSPRRESIAQQQYESLSCVFEKVQGSMMDLELVIDHGNSSNLGTSTRFSQGPGCTIFSRFGNKP